MENEPFADDFPNKTSIDNGFSIAMLNYQRVHVLIAQNRSKLHPISPAFLSPKMFDPLGNCGEFHSQAGSAQQEHHSGALTGRLTGLGGCGVYHYNHYIVGQNKIVYTVYIFFIYIYIQYIYIHTYTSTHMRIYIYILKQ